MQVPSFVSRRAWLGALGALSIGAAIGPVHAHGGEACALLSRKRLVVLMLAGGNDGLNMVVPTRDALYRRMRPTLAIPADRCRSLDSEWALHPALPG